jgi:CubicO group peptidase (beta-lactamase class C family)
MTRHARRALFLLSLCLLVVPPLVAQDRFADLARVVTAELEETKTPGALVAIVQDGKVVYAKGFGVANVETGQPMTPDMTFPLASMTKMYTATALVSLAEEGQIDLQAPIGKYLDNLPPKLATVTAHQLLSHTAGFRDDAGISNRAHDDSTIEELVRAYTDGIFFTEPGTVFSYANQGFNLSGYLVARLSGKRYSQAIQDRIFGPLETLDFRGVRLVEHGGTLAGSATDFVMAPARHVAVIVFANRQSHLTRTVDKALETMLPVGPKPAAPTPITLTADESGEYGVEARAVIVDLIVHRTWRLPNG